MDVRFNGKEIFERKILILFSLWYSRVSSKNVSPFDPTVWPAVANILQINIYISKIVSAVQKSAIEIDLLSVGKLRYLLIMTKQRYLKKSKNKSLENNAKKN